MAHYSGYQQFSFLETGKFQKSRDRRNRRETDLCMNVCFCVYKQNTSKSDQAFGNSRWQLTVHYTGQGKKYKHLPIPTPLCGPKFIRASWLTELCSHWFGGNIQRTLRVKV